MTGFMPILEASKGYLLGGRTRSDGVVFDSFFEALTHMNDAIESNRQAFRKIRVAKVMEFEGVASCWVNEPDDERVKTP